MKEELMEFQVAETVEQLEAQHSELKHRIAQAVEQASKGENDGAGIVGLTRESAALASRIEAAKVERERAENARRRSERKQAAIDLVKVRTECLQQRDLFLSSYRSACIALGSYRELQNRACELTGRAAGGFGVQPFEMSALKELELGNKPREILDGLTPDVGEGWRTSFAIVPMYTQSRAR
jgi:hypothetical protein